MTHHKHLQWGVDFITTQIVLNPSCLEELNKENKKIGLAIKE